MFDFSPPISDLFSLNKVLTLSNDSSVTVSHCAVTKDARLVILLTKCGAVIVAKVNSDQLDEDEDQVEVWRLDWFQQNDLAPTCVGFNPEEDLVIFCSVCNTDSANGSSPYFVLHIVETEKLYQKVKPKGKKWSIVN